MTVSFMPAGLHREFQEDRATYRDKNNSPPNFMNVLNALPKEEIHVWHWELRQNPFTKEVIGSGKEKAGIGILNDEPKKCFIPPRDHHSRTC